MATGNLTHIAWERVFEAVSDAFAKKHYFQANIICELLRLASEHIRFKSGESGVFFLLSGEVYLEQQDRIKAAESFKTAILILHGAAPPFEIDLAIAFRRAGELLLKQGHERAAAQLKHLADKRKMTALKILERAYLSPSYEARSDRNGEEKHGFFSRLAPSWFPRPRFRERFF